MPVHSKGNVPPVIGAAPKTFIERRIGPGDRRVADRRVVVDRRIAPVSDRRISISADRRMPLERISPHSRPAGVQSPSEQPATPQAVQQRGKGLIVVDAVDVDKARRVYRVEPDVFMDIVHRLNLSMVIHYQKRQGMNTYFIQFEGGVVETHTPNRLSMLDETENEMEEPARRAPPVVAADKGGKVTVPGSKPQQNKVQQREPQTRSRPKENVMAHKKQPLMEFHTEEGYYVTEWWNSPDDPALSVARMRVEPGATTSAYALHGITERFLFLSGHGIVEIDERLYEVGPGDGLLVKAGARRRVSNRGDRDLGFLAICRPRFSRLSEEPMQNKFVKERRA